MRKLLLLLFLFSFIWAEEKFHNVLILEPDNALELALRRQMYLKFIREKKEINQQYIKEKWMDYLPSLGISYSRQKYILKENEDIIYNELRLNAEQLIYDGGRRNTELELAKLNLSLSKEEYRNELNRSTYEFKNAYQTVLASQIKTRLYYKSYIRSLKELKWIEKELGEGFLTESDKLYSESRLKEVELYLQKAKNEYSSSLRELKRQLGIIAKEKVLLSDNLLIDYILRKPPLSYQDFKSTITQNAGLKAKKELLQARIAQREKSMQDKFYLPNISLGAYLGKTSETFPLNKTNWGVYFKLAFPFGGNPGFSSNSSLNSRSNNSPDTGVNVKSRNINSLQQSDLQVPNHYSIRRKQMESHLNFRKSVYSYNSKLLNIEQGIEENLGLLNEHWNSIRLSMKTIEVKHKLLGIQQLALQVGSGKRLDVLNSELDLIKAEDFLFESLLSYFRVANHLIFITGDNTLSTTFYSYEKGKGSMKDFLSGLEDTRTNHSEKEERNTILDNTDKLILDEVTIE